MRNVGFNITRFYTDDWGAYKRHLEPEEQVVGKEGLNEKI
jgi:hypothetical protein